MAVGLSVDFVAHISFHYYKGHFEVCFYFLYVFRNKTFLRHNEKGLDMH